jgi:hypothetical protein
MNKVFVVQQNIKRSEDGTMVPRFDMTKAYEFGDVRIILPHGSQPSGETKERLKENLKAYTDDDYILPVGNPTLIGWAVYYAACYNDGFVKTLQWNSRKNSYDVISQIL